MNTKKSLLEINKPSEMCQVMYFDNYKKMIFASLTPTQIDLMNLLIYESKKQILKDEITIDNTQASFPIEIELKTISNLLNKYPDGVYAPLIEQLNGLRKMDIVINVLGKNKNMETTLTSLIHEIVISKHKSNSNKIIKLHLSTKVINMFLDIKRLFSKMYLTIQLSMKSKYSKLLYELCKDYKDSFNNSKTIDFDMLLGLLNAANNKRYFTFSYFNNDILKKAVKEINEKSDIIVSYEPIKERPEGARLQVTKIKFTMQKQSDERLKELGLINQPDELSIEEQIKYNRKKAIALTRLEQSKKYQNIDNEEAWLKKTITSITDEFLVEQDLLEDAKEKIDALDIKEYGNLLMKKYNDVVGLKDYKLFYVFTDKMITHDAIETLKILTDLSIL